MEGPRAPQEHEWSRVVDFLNTHLRPAQNWSIAAEYPTALTASNRFNSRVIMDGDQVISHAIVRPIIMKTPIGAFKIAGIGSVVTSNGYRNQGLSTQILESCLQAAKDSQCDLAILWTDLYDFYRRLGFELAGSEISFEIDRAIDLPVSNASLKLRYLDHAKIDAEAMLRLFNQHSVASHRTVEDVRNSLAIPNSRVSTAWDSSGRMVAYAIEGKGADLDRYIHEWGGGVQPLCALIDHMVKSQNRSLRLIAPSHSTNLIQRLAKAGFSRHDGFLGMMKLIRCDSFFEKVKRHARSLGINDLVLEKKADRFYFGRGSQVGTQVESQLYSTDSEVDVLRLLFGPAKPSSLHSFDTATAATLDQLLPIPIWIWGWDSV